MCIVFMARTLPDRSFRSSLALRMRGPCAESCTHSFAGKVLAQHFFDRINAFLCTLTSRSMGNMKRYREAGRLMRV